MSLLFDEIERTDSAPKKASEDNFAFLNRVAGSFWSPIRDELNRWFGEYPADHRLDLRNRFRSPRRDQHWGAWWELYLFRLFGALGMAVEVHPLVPGSSARPDFRLVADQTIYLEATTVFSGIVEEGRNADREAWLIDALNEVKSTDFVSWLHFEQVGMSRPPAREVVEPVEEWLRTLAADQTDPQGRLGFPLPAETFTIRDWRIRLEAFPRKRERRQLPADQFVGIGPISSGFVDDRDRIGRALEKKKKHHSKVDAPLVLAVLGMSPVLDQVDVTQALFGTEAVEIDTGRLVRQPNGLWRSRRGASGRGVSAALIGSGVQPWSVAKVLPRLWLNPWATNPLQVHFPLPVALVEDEQLTFVDGTLPPHEILGVPPDWPGDPNSRFRPGDQDTGNEQGDT